MGYTPPHLEVRKITGGWSLFPPTLTSTDDLKIYPNGTDLSAMIEIDGNGAAYIISRAGNPIYLQDSASGNIMKLTYATPDCVWESTIADKNIFLKTAGTGVVKFGSYTAGAATDSTGYISILDAAGNARKLMVQA